MAEPFTFELFYFTLAVLLRESVENAHTQKHSGAACLLVHLLLLNAPPSGEGSPAPGE